jgi:hypothetical protein
MSCTQFHSIKLFILRHAWLNLLDKHMTTGRINQVTIVMGVTGLPLHSLRGEDALVNPRRSLQKGHSRGTTQKA